MGGDVGPPVTVPAALRCAVNHTDLSIKLFGQSEAIRQAADASLLSCLQDRLSIHHCDQWVSMDDKPSTVLRQKTNSSMGMALKAVADGEADACISAGNTGALMVLARSLIGMLPGIDRPAFMTPIPSLKANGEQGRCYLLDLGANLNCDADQLIEFALMGDQVARSVDGLTSPRVALLNVGQEDVKGNEVVKSAAARLRNQQQLNFVGYVEGDHIFADEADVIVCDGFVGNAALKASEGLARMINLKLAKALNSNPYRRFCGMLVRPLIKGISQQLDPARYNGASLLGLDAVVIKSHGNAGINAFQRAIERSLVELDRHIGQRIVSAVRQFSDYESEKQRGVE